MKTKKILVLMMAFALFLTACGKGGAKDGVAATVDGVEIPQKSFDLYYGIQRSQIVSQLGEDYFNQPVDKLGRSYGELLRENILKSLISNQVILNAAKDEDLGDIDGIVEEQINNEKSMSGDELFAKNLESIGLNEDEYKKVVKDNIIVKEFRAKKMKSYEVTEEEKKAYFEENKDALLQKEARHILVKTEEEAKKVKERLAAGEDFGELAKELSLDKVSAANGGSLGYFGKGTMLEAFDNYVFSSEVGVVSEPIQSNFGYHIIEVTGVKDKYEDFGDDLDAAVRSKKFADEMMALEEKAKIKKLYDTAEEPESIKEQIKSQEEQKTEDKKVEGAEEVKPTEEAPVEENSTEQNTTEEKEGTGK